MLYEVITLATQLPAGTMQQHDRALQERLIDLVHDLFTRYDAFGQEVKWRPLNRQHQYLVNQCRQFVTSLEGAEASILDVCKALT